MSGIAKPGQLTVRFGQESQPGGTGLDFVKDDAKNDTGFFAYLAVVNKLQLYRVSTKIKMMKTLLMLAIVICSSGAFGQAPANKISGVTVSPDKEPERDTILKVVYPNEKKRMNNPALFINGRFVAEMLLVTLSPRQIDSVEVAKGSVKIGGVTYHGQFRIKMKDNYILNLISLNDLKDKYTNLKNKPVVFMIDGNIVNADYDKYMVDEGYLLEIMVDSIENKKEKIDLGLVKLLTRSDENIKKSKEIRLRGTERAWIK